MHKKQIIPLLFILACGVDRDNLPEEGKPDMAHRAPAPRWRVQAAGQANMAFSPVGLLAMALGSALDVAVAPAAPITIEGDAVKEVPAVAPGCVGLAGVALGESTLIAQGPAGPVATLSVTVRRPSLGVCLTPPGSLVAGALRPGGTVEGYLQLDVPGRYPAPLVPAAVDVAGLVLGPCPGTPPAHGAGCWLFRRQAVAPAAFTTTVGTETFPIIFQENLLQTD